MAETRTQRLKVKEGELLREPFSTLHSQDALIGLISLGSRFLRALAGTVGLSHGP